MQIDRKIFSELKGFVIYEPLLLRIYLVDNQLYGNSILSYFMETEHGEIISREGIAIPIIDIPDDYYAFKLQNEPSDTELSTSKGWILNSISGNVQIVGIGYLKDVSLINESNSLLLQIKKGWQEVSITSVINV